MFSGSKLLGTPRGGNRNAGTRTQLEFTPIGRTSNREHKRVSVGSFEDEDKENYGIPLGPKELNRGKITNMKDLDLTLDNTDEFSIVGNSPFKPLNNTLFHRPMSGSEVVHEHAELINNGMTSIQEQQQQISRLNTENYNLKIEIKALRHYLNQIPEDQRSVFDLNIKLEQQLANAAKKIDSLSGEVRQLQATKSEAALNSKKEEELLDHMETMRSKYESLLESKDNEIDDYRVKHESLVESNKEELGRYRDKYESVIQSKEDEIEHIEAKLHHLETTNKSAQLSSADSERLKRDLEMVNDEAEHLREVNRQLKHDLEAAYGDSDVKDRTIRSLNERVDDLQLELDHWKSKYEKIDFELRQNVDSSHDSLVGAKEEVRKLNEKIEELHYENQNAVSQLERSRKEVQDLLHNGKTDNSKLLEKLDYMNQELKRYERTESSLRAQINALVREKTEGTKNSYDIYEAQIEALTASESKLSEVNKKLNAQIAQLRDEIYHVTSSSSGFDSRLASVQRQNKELGDKLQFYEQEFETVEDAYKNTDKSLKQLQREYDQLNSEYQIIREENNTLVEQIKAQAKSSNFSALSELEKFNLKKLESEHQNLEQEIETLNTELARLKRELDYEKSNNHTEELQVEIKKLRRELDFSTDNGQVEHLQTEIRRLRNDLEFERDRKQPSTSEYRPMTPNNSVFLESECHKLHMEKDSLSNNLRDVEHKYRNLQACLVDKEDLLDRLEIQLKELKRANKRCFTTDEDVKTELMQAKVLNESKVRQLELEKESLQKDYEFQIQHYKMRIEELLSKSIKAPGPSAGESGSVISLLEKQIDEAYKAKNELSHKVTELAKNQEELQNRLEVTQKETSHLSNINNTYEQNEKLYRLQKDQLELENKTTQEELNKVTSHCHKLVSKLNELQMKFSDDKDTKLNNQSLQRRIDELNSRLSKTHISSPNPSRVNSGKSVFYEEQLKYYKAKLYDINLKANDLELMYNFVIKSVKNSSGLLKNDLFKLSKLGIYPDYKTIHQKKLKFSVVAKFVLSMVRLKKRQEKAERRRQAIAEIKSSVDKKKKIMMIE